MRYLLIAIAVCAFAAIYIFLDKKECESKGGVLIRGLYNNICIDRSVIK